MSDAYEKDITERTNDRNLILLGCRADADIDYRDRIIKMQNERLLNAFQLVKNGKKIGYLKFDDFLLAMDLKLDCHGEALTNRENK